MTRAHIFVASIMLVLAAVLAVILGLQYTDREQTAHTTNSYTSFSAEPSSFSSLEPVAAPSTPRNTTPQNEIATLIRDWETRDGARVARRARGELTETVRDDSPTTEDVGVLFSEMIGPRITQQLNGTAVDDSSSRYDELLWSGHYDSTQQALESGASTKTQQDLHDYGNELGETLTTFERDSDNQVALLDQFVKNRTEEARIADLKELRDRYRTLSSDIAAINAPSVISDTHAALAQGYADVADGLWALREPTGDEAFVEQLLSYNDTAEAVAKLHIDLVTTFKAYGITFDEHEPGRVFTFSPSAL